MYWDNIAGVYDIFANIINKKTNKALCNKIEELISPEDKVLECACGTGLLSGAIAKKCKKLIATDFSPKMLKKASEKHKEYKNIEFKICDILKLDFPNDTFDVVVAANVIHLLDEPYKALSELDRVCRKGGKIIIPTYMNKKDNGKINSFINKVSKTGVDFKQQFDLEGYKKFIEYAGYKNVKYTFIEGKLPCAIAEIKK